MVSIIVPVYNCKSSLPLCIASIQKQTLSDWELILVDDGSSDGSAQICDQAASEDNRIQVVHKANGGVSSARNAGIQRAAGEYLLFCDSDDYPESAWCEKLLKSAKQYPKAFPICNYYRETPTGQKINYEQACASLQDQLKAEDFFLAYQYELLGTPWNKIYDREILIDKNIVFPMNMSLGEDLLFNLQYMQEKCDGLLFIHEPLYHYVLGNTGSLTSRYHKNLYEMYQIIFEKLAEALHQFPGAFEKYKDEYYKSQFFAFDRVFRNTYSPRNCSSMKCKRNYNKKVFYTKKFQMCCSNIKKEMIHPLQYFALQTKQYTIYWMTVMFTEKVSKMIHKQ